MQLNIFLYFEVCLLVCVYCKAMPNLPLIWFKPSRPHLLSLALDFYSKMSTHQLASCFTCPLQLLPIVHRSHKHRLSCAIAMQALQLL